MDKDRWIAECSAKLSRYGVTTAVQTWEDVARLLWDEVVKVRETERTDVIAALQNWAHVERDKTPDARIGDGSAQTFEEAASRIARKLHRG